MQDTEDTFFNGYLRRNMAKIVTEVKVRELVPHLPRLTQSDRENIEAKRESTGNYNAMQLLFGCLRHKDNWLEEFISGLKTCEHSGLASQIQEEYKSLRVQPNGSALAPMAPTSAGNLQPPLNLGTVATPKIDAAAAADVASSLPHEAISGDGILANHITPSQSPAEPAASVQIHTTEDIGAVTPTSHISSPAVPSPSPQVPAVKPVQDANPPEKKPQNASDKPPDTSKVSAQGLHLNPVVGSPTEEVGRASADEEVSSNKPVLLTSIHCVQVHQPFDSPSAFPPIPDERAYSEPIPDEHAYSEPIPDERAYSEPIPDEHAYSEPIPDERAYSEPIRDEGAYSDDTVTLDCSSSLSHRSSESVNAENVAFSDAKVSPGDAGNVDPGEESSIALSDTEKGASGEESSIALSDTEKGASGDAESVALSEAVNVAPGEESSIALSDTEKGASGDAESVALSEAENVAPGEESSISLSDTEKGASGDAESVALSEAENVAPGEESSKALSDTEKGASGDAESVVLSEAENVAPGDAESIAFSDAEKVVLSQLSGVTLSDAEMVVPGDTQSVAQGDAESESFSQINAAKVAPEELKNVALCDPESVAPGDVESEALSDAERVAPSYAKCVTFTEKDVVSPHDVEGELSGDKSATGSAVESFQPENKYTDIASNEDDIGDANSTTPENRENVVSDKEKVVIVNAESLVGENTGTIICDKLEGSSLEDPESRAEKNHCYSDHHDIPTSSHNPESVIHDIVGPGNTQNRAADIMETTAYDSMDSAPSIALELTDPTYSHLTQNVLKENDCDIAHHEISSPDAHQEISSPDAHHEIISPDAHQEISSRNAHHEISSPDAPSSNCKSESFFFGEAENGVPGEGDSGAPDGRDSGAPDGRDSGDQVNSECGTPAEGHSEASCDEDNGDTESEAPGGRDNEASGDRDSGAPGEGDSGAPGEEDNGAPRDGGSYTAREDDSGGPQEKDNRESADKDSGVPGTGESMSPGEGKSGGPGEGESQEPEVRNIQGPGQGEIVGYAGGDRDTPCDIDSVVPDEVCIVVPSCTELSENNTEGNQDFNHLGANLPASLSNHIPKSIIPSNAESATESTHKELRENQYNSTHLEISLPSSALSNHSPEKFRSKDVEGRISGNTEPLHLETEENHCNAFHLKIGLSSEESFFPDAASASPNNMGSQSPGDGNSSNKEPVENHRSSTHLTINLTSPASLNNTPDSAAYADMKSHIHKPTTHHCSAPCCDITDEQDTKKLCLSEDLAPHNHTMPGETAVGVITEKKLEAFPEQGQLNQRSRLGNYYFPAAVAGVVAAAMLWQLKK